jgi:hypothetical protein
MGDEIDLDNIIDRLLEGEHYSSIPLPWRTENLVPVNARLGRLPMGIGITICKLTLISPRQPPRQNRPAV